MTTQLFFDTEFTGLHKKTTLISIGIVSNCGKSFYAEILDYDKFQINEWLTENVISNLEHNGEEITLFTGLLSKPRTINMCGKKKDVTKALSLWLSQFDSVEIWSDCLSYNWVLFNDLFGTAFDIPSNVYYIPFDICTLFKIKNIDPDISREEFSGICKEIVIKKNNALFDAEIIRFCYNKLINM